MEELERYHYDIQELESTEQAMLLRGVLQDGIKRIKELIGELDTELIRLMREQSIESFEFGMDDMRRKIYVAKDKKEKITSTSKLRDMLFSEDDAERELSRAALSTGQSAWKIAQVKILADTLGIDLVETTYGDKVMVKEIPVDKLPKPNGGK